MKGTTPASAAVFAAGRWPSSVQVSQRGLPAPTKPDALDGDEDIVAAFRATGSAFDKRRAMASLQLRNHPLAGSWSWLLEQLLEKPAFSRAVAVLISAFHSAVAASPGQAQAPASSATARGRDGAVALGLEAWLHSSASMPRIDRDRSWQAGRSPWRTRADATGLTAATGYPAWLEHAVHKRGAACRLPPR